MRSGSFTRLVSFLLLVKVGERAELKESRGILVLMLDVRLILTFVMLLLLRVLCLGSSWFFSAGVEFRK